MKERWAEIEGTGGLYHISTLGRIKSLYYGKERILKQTLRKRDKRYQVVLHINKKLVTMKPHRLVAIAFIDNPEGFEEVNHKDGNPRNNSIENLEWCSREYNLTHSLLLGIDDPERRNQVRKLSSSQVIRLIDDHRNKKYTTRQLADKYGISRATLWSIVNGKAYKHITKNKTDSPAS